MKNKMRETAQSSQLASAKLEGIQGHAPGKFLRNWCKTVHSESYL